MACFAEGEQVTIRYGRHQGRKGTILKRQPGGAYKVKLENGLILFYSSKGLERVEKAVS